MSASRAARALTIAALAAAASAVLAAKGTKSPAEARALYETKCGPCHGKAGKPAPMFAKLGIRALDDAEWQKATSDDQIRASIQAGKPGTTMRAFKDELKAEDLEGLVRHIRTLPAAPAK